MTSVWRICFIRSDTLPSLDKLRADVFGEGGELLQLRRIGEEAGQEMENS